MIRPTSELLVALVIAGCASSEPGAASDGGAAPLDAGDRADVAGGPDRLDADCELPSFEAPIPVTVEGWSEDVMEPFITSDGTVLLFNNSNAPDVNTDLHWARRRSETSFDYQGPVSGVATPALEGVPSMDDAGNLYFVSTRSYEENASTIYRGRFEAGVVTNVRLVPNISREQPPIVNFDVEVSRDGRSLLFVDGRFDPAAGFWSSAELVLAVDRGSGFERVPDDGLDAIDSEDLEYAPALSPDEQTLYFTRVPADRSSPPQIWVTVRAQPGAAFCPPAPVPGLGDFVEAVTVMPDDDGILFHRQTTSGFRLFLSRPR